MQREAVDWLRTCLKIMRIEYYPSDNCDQMIRIVRKHLPEMEGLTHIG